MKHRRNRYGVPETANDKRTAEAAVRVIEKCEQTLALIATMRPVNPNSREGRAREQHIAALRARVAHPEDTLAEIAASEGVTKDAYWSALRRAMIFGDNLRRARSAHRVTQK